MKTDLMQENSKNPETEKENPDNTPVKEVTENKQTKKNKGQLDDLDYISCGIGGNLDSCRVNWFKATKK